MRTPSRPLELCARSVGIGMAGSGTGNALLPSRSHVVPTKAGGALEWWDVDVIGVTTQQAWHRIVKGKSYSTIQGMRVAGNPGVTDDLPTNLFLFFLVAEK